MAQDFLIDINSFSQGLQLLQDSTDAPIGSARSMVNMLITDRGGIAPRPGTAILGTYDSGTTGCDGFFTFLKTGVETEIPLKASNGLLKYYHPTKTDWETLNTGYTAGAEFGFKEHLINTDNEDYCYFCNGVQNYSRWSGATAVTSGAYVSGTTLTVDSNLKTTAYELGTSTGTSTTTITDSSKTWASSQWIGFYVLITSGAQTGKISLITANTSTQLTFDAITDPGAGCTYQIRMPKFPASGTLIVGGTQVAYSAIPTSTTFTITDPGVGFSDNTAVTIKPTEYPANPRGNRLENHHTRMLVGNVQSGMARNAAGTLQGSQSTATVYVSKIRNATDFTFSATRVACEGDLITAPYGGGNITDIVNFEDSFAVFKKYYIELNKYSTDSTADLPSSTPLKQGYGSVNHVIKGKDDVYFVTADKQITSIGRVQLHDTVPQTTNIGLIVKRLIDDFDFSDVVGKEFGQRILFSCKQSSSDNANNQILIYNKQNKTFEGVWYLNASQFDIYNGKLYAADSITPNVYQLFTSDHNDVRSSTVKFGIESSWLSNWMHITPSSSKYSRGNKFKTQSINAIGFQGYIADGTVINFSLYKDFSDTAELQFDFGLSSSDENFLQGAELGAFLGSNPLGLAPLGTITDPDPAGRRHFKFIIYFPDIYSSYFSVGISNSGTDQDFEITRMGLGTSEEVMQDQADIKMI